MNKKQVGRPERSRIENVRTKVWALAVLKMSAGSHTSLSDILGEAGKWEGVWKRYCLGLVSPSESRLRRVDQELPGSSQYYRCPIWITSDLKSWNRKTRVGVNGADQLKWRLDEIRAVESTIPRSFFYYLNHCLVSYRDYPSSIRFLRPCLKLLANANGGISALSYLYIRIQHAIISEHARLFCVLAGAWTLAEKMRIHHPILKHIPQDLFQRALEGLQNNDKFLREVLDLMKIEPEGPMSYIEIYSHFDRGIHWRDIAVNIGALPPSYAIKK